MSLFESCLRVGADNETSRRKCLKPACNLTPEAEAAALKGKQAASELLAVAVPSARGSCDVSAFRESRPTPLPPRRKTSLSTSFPMFGKVKKWLGIEGVKLELVLPELAFEAVGAVSGKIRFYSKHTQAVSSIRLVMIEKYSRGRGKERLVDEYLIGEAALDQRFEVPAEEVLEVDFTLPFELAKSRMDEFGSKNILTGSMAKLAKKLRNVDSEFRIEAEAKVEGTALNPFDRRTLKMVEA